MLQARALGLVCLLAADARAEEAGHRELPSRTFLFDYGAMIEHLNRGQMAPIWLPIPSPDAQQEVEIASGDLRAKPKMGIERAYGNRLDYIETRAKSEGAVHLEMVYRVTRRETVETPHQAFEKTDPEFLRSNALIPINGRPLSLLANSTIRCFCEIQTG